MASGEGWIDIGSASELAQQMVTLVETGKVKVALSCVKGTFGAVHNVCNHAGARYGACRKSPSRRAQGACAGL